MKTQAILIAAVALLLGTEGGLIKPSPGTAGDLLQGLTRPAPNTRKVLPNLGNYLLFKPMHLIMHVPF
jgi:hypothetical protein